MDRCCVSGSFGKRTSVVEFDIDLAIFVIGSTPPFDDVIRVLEQYLPKEIPNIEIDSILTSISH